MKYSKITKEQIEGCIKPHTVVDLGNGLYDVLTHQEEENYLAEKANNVIAEIQPAFKSRKTVEDNANVD